MQQGQGSAANHRPTVTNFAIVLDCSGSIGEATRDGQVKIDVAKQVFAELISKIPEKLRVTFLICGYDHDLNCKAVEVARSLGTLDTSGKLELVTLVSSLRPVADTPIALALETAGQELAKNDTPCGLVLLTDGKETCGGNPVEVAARLVRKLNLSYGVNVIGFDVRNDERDSLAEIARAGKGKYRTDSC
jgi:Ca-activated chloride channel homolog